jgi:hypothetical protein
MKREQMEKWLDNADPIKKMVLLMCGMNVKDESYKFTVHHKIDNGSWCAVDSMRHTVEIHIGLPEWLDDDHPEHPKYVAALGREFDENDLFALYMDLAMHEFMHACITRTGKTIQQIAAKFPIKNPAASPWQQTYYKQNVEKLIHFWHNAVCDARIENIGKNMFNVEQYFDFGRILDYLVATEGSGIKSWDLGYAMLQLGVIGKYPQFDIDPEAKVAIEALRMRPMAGTTAVDDLLAKFICEPHPTISVKQFAAWFDVPEFHDYVEKIIFEEVETKSEVAEKLFKKLEKMPQEVRMSGNAPGNPGIPMDMPGSISVKTANKDGENGKQGKGTGDGSGDKKDEKKSKDAGNGGDKDGKEGKNKKDGGGSKSGKNGEKKNAAANGNQDGSQDGQDGDGSSKNSKAQKSNKPASESNSMEDHETFDENGEWSLSESDDSGNNEKELEENESLRSALDEVIKTIATTAKALAKKPTKSRKAEKAPLKGSKADVVIDTTFKADMYPPAKVVANSKPLRKILKDIFSENIDEEIIQLRSGSLDTSTAALCRFRSRDASIFKTKRLPTISEAVYYICWDGSGSMCGTKQSESAYACAVIEEAVRGIYPMKIINFSTHGSVVHYVVKEFDDKSKKNCAYSFGAKRSFSGGNKDGYSIRQCAEELAKRPEDNKFLIVLSDGAPSDYPSHEAAVEDVKGAVAFARSKKIDVTSIFFGSQYERDREIELYNEMYGAGHIISCDPSEIVAHMIKIVKKNVRKH